MLTLLRAEDFRRTLKTEPVNLVELIQKVIDQVRPFLEARRLRLVTELDDDLGPFELDADKISAVLDQPDHERDQVHARRRDDRAGGPAGAGPERRDPGARPRRRARSRGAQARVSAFFHAARSQPPLLGRLWLQQAGAGPGPLHRQEFCRDARRNDCGGVPRRRRHADHGASASPGESSAVV